MVFFVQTSSFSYHFYKEQDLSLFMVRFELGDKISLSPMGSFGHPHGTGRLGYKKLTLFNSSLCLKSLWRCLLFQSLWSDVMNTKYLKNTPVSTWIRSLKFVYTSVWMVWNSFLKFIHWMKKCILEYRKWEKHSYWYWSFYRR